MITTKKALRAQGAALFDEDRFVEALALYDGALAHADEVWAANLQRRRAPALWRLGRNEEALAACRAAAAVLPPDAGMWNTEGGVLMVLRRFDEAVACFERAIALDPDYPIAHVNLGIACMRQDLQEQAIVHLDRAAALAGRFPRATVASALCRFQLGDFAGGRELYETRFENSVDDAMARLGAPVWNGQDLAGKTILVHAEQGLGDSLQFHRYLPLLRQKGARVLFAAQKPLWPLLRRFEPQVALTDPADPGEAVDYQARLLSIPWAFHGRIEDIPKTPPYLTAEPERVEAWRARLGPAGFKVGVCWMGSAVGVGQGRTMPPQALERLAKLPAARLISLQKGAEPPPGVERLDDDFDTEGDAFMDTAAVMTLCDLVISCDTSVHHVAGALGRPVWLALAKPSSWQWQRDRTDTPWYPGHRLFRQPAVGDWSGVFEQMEAELTVLARRA